MARPIQRLVYPPELARHVKADVRPRPLERGLLRQGNQCLSFRDASGGAQEYQNNSFSDDGNTTTQQPMPSTGTRAIHGYGRNLCFDTTQGRILSSLKGWHSWILASRSPMKPSPNSRHGASIMDAAASTARWTTPRRSSSGTASSLEWGMTNSEQNFCATKKRTELLSLLAEVVNKAKAWEAAMMTNAKVIEAKQTEEQVHFSSSPGPQRQRVSTRRSSRNHGEWSRASWPRSASALVVRAAWLEIVWILRCEWATQSKELPLRTSRVVCSNCGGRNHLPRCAEVQRITSSAFLYSANPCTGSCCLSREDSVDDFEHFCLDESVHALPSSASKLFTTLSLSVSGDSFVDVKFQVDSAATCNTLPYHQFKKIGKDSDLQHRNFRSRRLRHQIPLCSQLSHHDVILRTKPKPHSRRCSRRFVHRVTVRRRACRRWLRTRPALAESSSRRRCSTRQTMFDTFLSFSLFCMHSFLQSRFLFSLLPYDT